MAKWVYIASLAGFVIGVFWCVMFFVFFTAEPHGLWWALYFILMMVTCPAWFLGAIVGPLIPFANAAIYALVAFCAYKLRESGHPRNTHVNVA